VDDSRQVLTQIVISESQQHEIDAQLARLKDAAGASSVLLIERSGLLLANCGEGAVNDLSVSSLIAGIFKSLSALTSLLGEPEVRTFQHRGNRSTLILVLLESKDMLGVTVAPDAPQESFEGAVEAAVQQLTPVLIAARESTRNTPFSFSKDAISVFLGRL
jgi:predicted regulator of Ras-like GTPase activity (Roadblock/LC7/MglB family)